MFNRMSNRLNQDFRDAGSEIWFSYPNGDTLPADCGGEIDYYAQGLLTLFELDVLDHLFGKPLDTSIKRQVQGLTVILYPVFHL
jgi:hypothetical protein